MSSGWNKVRDIEQRLDAMLNRLDALERRNADQARALKRITMENQRLRRRIPEATQWEMHTTLTFPPVPRMLRELREAGVNI